MSLFKNVNVVQITVTDWERAKKFYTEVLDWPVAWAGDEQGWFEWGRDNEAHVAISLWRDDGHGPFAPVTYGTLLALAVDDANTATETLRAKGIKCDDAFTIPGIVTYGAFYDPDGNRVQFVSTPVPPAA